MSTPICRRGHRPVALCALTSNERGFDVPIMLGDKRVYACPICGQLFIDPNDAHIRTDESTKEIIY